MSSSPSGCSDELRAASVVAEGRLTALPYSDQEECGRLPPVVTVGVYSLP
jgi:hypothetical protein